MHLPKIIKRFFIFFSRHFYPKQVKVHSGYTFFCQYVCSLGIEPTTFALLTQCSTTEPQEQLYFEVFRAHCPILDDAALFQPAKPLIGLFTHPYLSMTEKDYLGWEFKITLWTVSELHPRVVPKLIFFGKTEDIQKNKLWPHT